MVRHIRNGIAHGSTKSIKEKGELYIEIKDFGRVSAGGVKGRPRTYIPVSYIPEMYKIYAEIEKAWARDRSKTEPRKKRKSA